MNVVTPSGHVCARNESSIAFGRALARRMFFAPRIEGGASQEMTSLNIGSASCATPKSCRGPSRFRLVSCGSGGVRHELLRPHRPFLFIPPLGEMFQKKILQAWQRNTTVSISKNAIAAAHLQVRFFLLTFPARRQRVSVQSIGFRTTTRRMEKNLLSQVSPRHSRRSRQGRRACFAVI